MSHSEGPHHNIWMARLGGCKGRSLNSQTPERVNEAGYSLVALLALMTVLALFAAAAAPNIRRQAQRENEKEAIFRGEQIANAIRTFYAYQQSRLGQGEAALPTSMDQLLEGIPSGTKRIQVLRPSAARDPLTAEGEWRLIRPRSGDLTDFQQALLVYTENIRPTTSDPQLQRIEQLMAPPVIASLGISSAGSSSIDDSNSSGPFIGVASRSKNNSLIYYYGIDRHDEWIFTPLFR